MKTTILLSIILLLSCSTILRTGKESGLSPKSVVLTFDDGPNATFNTTSRLLDVLHKHRVRAYFCIIGENARRNPDLVRRIHAQGHILVNHGYSDCQILTKGPDHIRNMIHMWNDTIGAILGTPYHATFFRPAFGLYNPNLPGILRENGIRVLPVSLYAMDAEVGPDRARQILDRTTRYLYKHNGGLVVLHDGKDGDERMITQLARYPHGAFNRRWIPDVADSLITHLRRNGFRIIVLDSTNPAQ